MSSFIPRQPKKEREQISIKLDREVLQNLEHYCRFIDSSRDYVINQCLTFIFRKDRKFQEWLEENGQVVESDSPADSSADRNAAESNRRKRSAPTSATA